MDTINSCEVVASGSIPLLAFNDLIYIQSDINEDVFKLPLRYHGEFRERCECVQFVYESNLSYAEQSYINKWLSKKNRKDFYEFFDHELEEQRSREKKTERADRGFKSHSDEVIEVIQKLEQFLESIRHLMKAKEPEVQARRLLQLTVDFIIEYGATVAHLFDPTRPSSCPKHLQEDAPQELIEKAFCLMGVVISFAFDFLADLLFSSSNFVVNDASDWLEKNVIEASTLVELIESFDKHWKTIKNDPRAEGHPRHVDHECPVAKGHRDVAYTTWRQQQTDTNQTQRPMVELKCKCSEKKSALWMTLIRSRSYLELALARHSMTGGASAVSAKLLGTSSKDEYLDRLNVAAWRLTKACDLQAWKHWHRHKCEGTTMIENKDWETNHFWPLHLTVFNGVLGSAKYHRVVLVLSEEQHAHIRSAASDAGLMLVVQEDADVAAHSVLEPLLSFTRAYRVKSGKLSKTKAGNPKIAGAGIKMDFAGIDSSLVTEIGLSLLRSIGYKCTG